MTTESTARDDLVDLLRANLPRDKYVVIPYAREIDPPEKPTVLVRIDTVVNGPAYGFLQWNFALVLIGAKTVAPQADQELDGFLEDVIYAVERLGSGESGLTWTEAERAVYPPDNPTHPAYQVATQVTTSKKR